MLFAISDPVAIAIITLLNGIVVVVAGWVTFLLKEWADRQRDERAILMEKKIDDVAKVGLVTHDLANSAMLSQKRLLANVTKAHAESTGKPEDRSIADAAELSYQEHLAGQEVSDAKELAAAKVIAAAKVVEKLKDEPPQPMH